MTEQPEIRIWISATCSGAPGYGGWAWVMQWGGELRGQAGGERRTTRERMDVAGLVAALQSVAADGAVPLVLQSANARLVRSANALRVETPSEDADLWNKAAAMLASRTGPVTMVLTPPVPGVKDRFTFVDAWAAFGLEKVKNTGAFTAPIPKSNLRNFPPH